MSAQKRPRELFPDGPPDDGDDDAEDPLALAADDGVDDEEVKVKQEGTGKAAPPRKRNRAKRPDEGDAKEIKPRHLRGKRRDEETARQLANAEEATKRAKNGSAEAAEATPALALQALLTRTLRPKARRWAMYEWFYSPVDLAWFRENAFQDALQDAGLGHVTHLTRIEWAFVRSLLGKPRRFSTAFLDGQRARLNEYRAHVRALRQLQLTGHSSTTAMETELGVHGALQRTRRAPLPARPPPQKSPHPSPKKEPPPHLTTTPCDCVRVVGRSGRRSARHGDASKGAAALYRHRPHTRRQPLPHPV